MKKVRSLKRFNYGLNVYVGTYVKKKDPLPNRYALKSQAGDIFFLTYVVDSVA